MSTSLTEVEPTIRAFSTSIGVERERTSSPFAGLSYITVVMDDKRPGDLPLPRFTSVLVTDEEQERTPHLIGAPNFLIECNTHSTPNGFLVTDYGRRLDIFYANADEEGGVVFDARGRVEQRLDGLIEKMDKLIGAMDATYKRGVYPYALVKR